MGQEDVCGVFGGGGVGGGGLYIFFRPPSVTPDEFF